MNLREWRKEMTELHKEWLSLESKRRQLSMRYDQLRQHYPCGEAEQELDRIANADAGGA